MIPVEFKNTLLIGEGPLRDGCIVKRWRWLLAGLAGASIIGSAALMDTLDFADVLLAMMCAVLIWLFGEILKSVSDECSTVLTYNGHTSNGDYEAHYWTAVHVCQNLPDEEFQTYIVAIVPRDQEVPIGLGSLTFHLTPDGDVRVYRCRFMEIPRRKSKK